jgi:hypothetical protein
MRQLECVVLVKQAFGVTTVIEIVQKTVALLHAVNMTEVVTRVLTVGMEQSATMRVI